MQVTQNETLQQSGKPKAESRRLGVQSSAFRFPPSAFTLVELLVVITIIGILAGLITGAAIKALENAKRTAIIIELKNIGGAMDDLKNDLGAYPPNGMIKNAAPTNYLAQNDFVRMFKKAFPRNQEPPELIMALAGGPVTGDVNVSGLEGVGMTGAEAIFFWLGGFSSDVSFPISGPGGPSFSDGPDSGTSLDLTDEVVEDRNLRYEFDLGRLLPRDSNNLFDASLGRFITYDDPRPGSGGALRRINLWLYKPTGSELPLAYFDTSRHTPAEYDLPLSGVATGVPGEDIYAIKKFREGVTSTTTSVSNADVRFLEDKKFQILHCGTDDIWGEAFASMYLDPTNNMAYQNLLLVPDGPFIGDVADTVGNFMGGKLEDEQE